MLQILSKEVLLFGVKLLAREKEGVRRSLHVRGASRSIRLAGILQFFEVRTLYILHADGLCVYVYMCVCVCAHARASYFSSPFWPRFLPLRAEPPPPVGHGKVQRLVTADVPQIVPACLITVYIMMAFRLRMQFHFHLRNMYDLDSRQKRV